MAVAVVASSCQKDLGGSPDSPVVPGAVPADFDWKTTRNVTVSVSTPVVEGATPPYAVIRIYSSPILSAENLAARGVAKSAMPFRSAFTLNAGTENLYVQTTLPDGTKSVKMVGAHGTVAVTGASMKAAAAPKMRLAANARVGSSMPDYPKMEAPDAASFDSKAVITAIESGKSYQLGASWAFYAAPEYLIPAGAEVAGKLDLNGGFSPYQAPILYVAGKLTLSSLNIGRAKLAVLPGGEVKIGTLKIQPSAADGAAVYVFADGKLSVGKPNVSGKCIVNNGTLTVDGSLDMNNGLTVYNTATGVLTVTDEMKVSNSARIYNDGAVTVDDLKINSDGEFHNCENALLVVNDECELERSTAIYQRGRASIEEMTARGTIWVNCHTSVNELEAQGAEFNFSANAGLDAGRVEFNNTNVSMARGAIFTMEEYNADEKGGGNRFAFTGDADPRAVVLISEKAYTRKGHETYFSGAIEVVYDNDRDKDYTIRKDYLTDGAVMSASQTTIIAENGSNVILSRDEIKLGEPVTAGAVMVDGLGVGDVGNVVLRDRHHLSEDGIIIVTAAVDGSTGQLLSGPDLVSRGFVYVRESEELMDGARVQVEMALDRSMADNMHDWASVKSRVREALSSYIYRKTKRSPMILPILMEV